VIELPKPIAHYFEAQKSRDVEAQSRCFTDDALVHDEGQDYRGRDAIRSWKQSVQAKFEYDSEPLATTIEGSGVRVLVRLTGNFPGSPVELEHRFTLKNDKIAELVIE
jgi:ketosteroid isomerase-like protein